MKKVIYGGSFDPITYGHKDVVERAAKHFDWLTVGIGVNAGKEGKYLFSLQERLHLVREVLKNLLNVDVVAYRGLTTHYAYENGYDLIIRGLRNGSDFDAEQGLDQAFKRQEQEKKNPIDTFFLNARQSMQDLSSSAAKLVIQEQGNIRDYVPMIVKQAMEGRMIGQYIEGISGGPGSGKSFTAEMFLKFCKENGINPHHLDMDKVGHYIQGTSQEPVYQATRHQIIQTFGDKVAKEDGSINRKILGDEVFDDPKKMEILDDIMRDPMKHRMNTLMYNQKGLFLYDAALIAEHNTSGIANNNIILLNVPQKLQIERLQTRGLPSDKIQKMLSSQFTTENKKKSFLEAIDQDQHGKLIEIQSPASEQDLKIAFNNMLAQIDTFGELRFGGLLNRLGVKEDPKNLFMQLRNTYDRPIDPNASRDEIADKMKGNYHKRLHVVDCLNEFYKIRHLVKNPDAMECAILFHDIIYDPINPGKNEEDSAVYAEKILTQRGLPADFIADVKRYILLTKHTTIPEDMDGKYMVDIDVSIFGKEFRKYLQYSKDVRREYSMYSDAKYKSGRKDVLKFFLNKENIFHTEYFQELYKDKAKQNIQHELDLLENN